MSITVSASNFGPIAQGTVEIRPFTVFIGPNNTGKSFLSTLIYAAEINTRRVPPTAQLRSTARLAGLQSNTVTKVRNAVRRQFGRSGVDLRHLISTMPKSSQAVLLEYARTELTSYGKSLRTELERCLGGKISDLASALRPVGSPMELAVSDNSLRWYICLSYVDDVVDFKVRIPPSRNLFEYADVVAFEAIQQFFPITENENRITIALPDIPRSIRNDYTAQLANVIMPRLLESIHDYLFQNFPTSRHYLPAARSGIMQSHKSLAAFLVRSAPLVGLQQMEVPQLSGIVADFIGQLLNLDTRRRRPQGANLAPVADELEAQVLHGKIEMRPSPSGYPEILYRVGRLEAPLVRLSSMISELAPVVLYVRYVLAQGHHLIIEEPEAHLHPESQRQFAKALADLLARGVSITLTTHSDYLLTEINNLIREQTVADVTRRPAPTSSIPASSVGAYLFARKQDLKGTVIEKLRVSESEGISDEEFGRVTEAIYHEAAELQYKIIRAQRQI